MNCPDVTLRCITSHICHVVSSSTCNVFNVCFYHCTACTVYLHCAQVRLLRVTLSISQYTNLTCMLYPMKMYLCTKKIKLFRSRLLKVRAFQTYRQADSCTDRQMQLHLLAYYVAFAASKISLAQNQHKHTRLHRLRRTYRASG